MNRSLAISLSLAALPLCLLAAQEPVAQDTKTDVNGVHSHVLETASGHLALVQTFVVEAPVSKVWKAYTTEEGWTAWASPKAEIDLRPGGTIRTHYGEDAEVGDPGTITLHIVNYVPERLITLRAELADHFPDIMKEDDGNLMEVTVFEPLSKKRTRVSSYGVGYRQLPRLSRAVGFLRPRQRGPLPQAAGLPERVGSNVCDARCACSNAPPTR